MPTNYFKLRYNGYNYNENLDWPATLIEGQPARLRESVPAGVDGGYSAGGLLGPRPLAIEGVLAPVNGQASDPASFRTAWDSFKAVHIPGVAQPLFIDDDRYINAEVVGISDSKWDDGLPNRAYEVQFRAYDPFWYAADNTGDSPVPKVTTDALETGANDIATLGTAYSLPIYSIIVTAAAGGSVTIVNGAGQSVTLTPTVTGTYSINTTIEDVLLGGVSTIAIMTGSFPLLAAGANVITVSTDTTDGDITLGDMSVSWIDQWY